MRYCSKRTICTNEVTYGSNRDALVFLEEYTCRNAPLMNAHDLTGQDTRGRAPNFMRRKLVWITIGFFALSNPIQAFAEEIGASLSASYIGDLWSLQSGGIETGTPLKKWSLRESRRGSICAQYT